MSSKAETVRAAHTNMSTAGATDGGSAEAATIPAVVPLNNHCDDRADQCANHPPVAPPAHASRRGFIMNSIVSAAAVASATAIPTQSIASIPADPDPVFAAIEAHRNANKAVAERVRENSGLQQELPRERRQSSITAFEQRIIEADDPRWIASEKAVSDAHSTNDDAAVELLSVQPTTLAGASALLNYYGEQERKEGWGNMFPDHVDYYDNGEAMTFGAAIALHVANALAKIHA